MRFRLALVLLALLFIAKTGADRIAGRGAGGAAEDAARAGALQEPAGPRLDRAAFAALVARLSESGGYFDTDNLISNEASYLHVIGGLERRSRRGGAYVGVGPDQNFSYIARTRPDIAFIIDIRRDNLLQHLWYKALFELAPTRAGYLALMLGREPPADPAPWLPLPIDRLIEEVNGLPAGRAPLDTARRRALETVATFGVPLSDADLATIGRIHARFAEAGFALRFNTFGRAPQPYYPTLAGLLREKDLQGRQVGYLASEEDYRFVRDLERRNLVIPVVGDLAGPKAMNAIAALLAERGDSLATFYASNVEYYLMRDGTFDRFARNLAALPAADDALLVRSVFGRFYAHPQNVPGYFSTQLLQRVPAFVAAFNAGAWRTYDDLVYAGHLERIR